LELELEVKKLRPSPQVWWHPKPAARTTAIVKNRDWRNIGLTPGALLAWPAHFWCAASAAQTLTEFCPFGTNEQFDVLNKNQIDQQGRRL
jgi:hypothetical protein